MPQEDKVVCFITGVGDYRAHTDGTVYRQRFGSLLPWPRSLWSTWQEAEMDIRRNQILEIVGINIE